MLREYARHLDGCNRYEVLKVVARLERGATSA
jgi:hypothetical protein